MDVTVFSWPNYLPGEIKLLKALVAQGLKTFHFRKPDWSKWKACQFLDELTDRELSTVVIHQHPGLRKHYPIKGIHFSSRLSIPQYGELLAEQDWFFTTSVHNLDQISTLPQGFRIVYISPIFESISKSNHFGKFEWSKLKQFLNHQKNPPLFYALGGMNAARLATARSLGFQGAGFLGSIWEPFRKYGYNAALNNYQAIIQASKSIAYGP